MPYSSKEPLWGFRISPCKKQWAYKVVSNEAKQEYLDSYVVDGLVENGWSPAKSEETDLYTNVQDSQRYCPQYQ